MNNKLRPVILMLRLYAMYGKSKKILALMVAGFSVVMIAEIIILVLSTIAQIGMRHDQQWSFTSSQLTNKLCVRLFRSSQHRPT